MKQDYQKEPAEPQAQNFKPKKNFLIGLTGGIGSGKTSVAKILENKGFPVYFSDDKAKEIANENSELKRQIIALLGENAYDEQGQYHRKWVAEQVFGNEDLLNQLNSLIHPAVKKDFEDWLSQQTAPFVFKETALLFELNLDENCDKSLLVTANDSLRIKRVMDRDGKTYREVEAIIQRQMPEKDKIKQADFVIYNNEDKGKLEEETLIVLKKLEEELLALS